MKLTRAVVAIGCALFLSCAAVLTGPAPAAAVATLYLSDGVNPAVTVTDGSPQDGCALAGCVLFNGSIGVWVLSVSTGVSNSPIPHIDLNSIDMSNGAGTSTLTIKFGDTDFSLGAGPHTVTLASAIGGTTDGSVTWQAGLNTSNLITSGCCDQLGALHGPAGSGAFSQTDLDTFSANGPFALELIATITHTGSGLQISSFDYEGRVPGPATLLLLGVGLLATGAMKRRIA